MSSDLYSCVEHTIRCGHIRQYPRSTSSKQEAVLHLAVKQYIPRYEICDGDVTILACHASAFPKELYEPIWHTLFERVQYAVRGQRIRAIWIADVANQGQSGILNEGQLGNEPSYFDHARDYLNLVNHFRDDMIRPIVGFGHSMGGNVIVNLALLHPRLLTSLVAVEPIVNASAAEMNFNAVFPLSMKKDRWSTEDDAMASITKSPFYVHWNPRVLDLYRKYGLRGVPIKNATSATHGKEVTLTTTKHQEVLSFARAAIPTSPDRDLDSFKPSRIEYPDMGEDRDPANAFYRPEATMTFQQLPYLRPSCYYIYGATSLMASAQVQGRNDKLRQTGVQTGGSGGAAAGRVKDTVVEGSHFVPFERPTHIATLMWQWMDTELETWRRLEETEASAWNAVSEENRDKVSPDYIAWVQKLWGKPSKKPSKL